ncbi:PKD domain-containing protein [Geodermatophilus sp. SYSU D00691]
MVLGASLLALGLPVVLAGPGVPGSVAEAATDPVIMAAGDIACAPGDEPDDNDCRHADTADLLTRQPLDAVLPMGDLQYDRATAAEFAGSYDPTWGRVKSISYPVPGNHEYDTAGAAGYFGYWGSRAGDPSRGYYSFDIGAWHLIALNSNCSVVSCSRGSAQETWLRADLAANAGKCTLAYWHHPRFSAGSASSSVGPFWDALYAAGADLVLAGHSHVYEHYAPQNPSGGADPQRGIRQFVVGTGGVNFGSLGSVRPNTVTRQNDTFGVLKLVLHGSSYDWEFVPIEGSSFVDTGTGQCHDSTAPQGPPTPTGLAVSGTPTASQVGLGWNASTGATGYRVYRNGSATPLNPAPVTGTAYTDTTVSGGTTYSYTVSAVDGTGAESPRSSPVTVTTPGTGPPGSASLDVPVRAGADDAEEALAGAVDLGSSDLELVTDGGAAQTVGLRFTGVAVPAGATITNAYVQFQVDEATTAATSLTVAAEATDNPAVFTTAARDVSARPRTSATVAWAPAAWPTVGARGPDQRTPDLAAVVQEVVSRPGWVSGNALALVLTGTGRRTAEAVESGAAVAPVLHVEYTTGGTGPANAAPTVSAGPDRSVVRPAAASLDGTVTDDGLPNPPAAVTTSWTKVSGPGTVTFANAAAVDTTATFDAPGTYVLRLTGSDSALAAADEVTVTVTDTAPSNAAPTVSAGPDRSVVRPAAASLDGTVTDDGLPNPPAAVTTSWTKVSGPGTVTFANAAAVDTTATFDAPGTYVLRLTGSDSALAAADEVTVTVTDTAPQGVTLDVPVRVAADDAEERVSTGAVNLTSGDLNLGQDGANAQVSAMRFTSVAVPAGATITRAWVQFQVDEVSTAACSLTVVGEAADSAAAFTTTARNLSGRADTTATVTWTPASWPTAAARAEAQRTPDLAAVVQEIVGRAGWASGNALVLTVTGTGTRVAESYDGGPARAPVLHIEYTA